MISAGPVAGGMTLFSTSLGPGSRAGGLPRRDDATVLLATLITVRIEQERIVDRGGVNPQAQQTPQST